MFHLPNLRRKKKFEGFAKFDTRNGFLSVSLVANQNTAFREQISDQCFILFQDSKKETVVGCWITNTRDFVITSAINFFDRPRTIGELFDFLVPHAKSKEIFGGGDQFLELVNNTEIRKLKIVLLK